MKFVLFKYDNLNGNEFRIDQPSELQVEQAVRELEPNQYSALQLNIYDKSSPDKVLNYLDIVCGDKFRYVVHYSYKDKGESGLKIAMDETVENPADIIEYLSEYERLDKTKIKNTVDLDTTIQIVQFFLETGLVPEEKLWRDVYISKNQ